MTYEISSGAIVFTRKNNNIYFVIIKSLEGYYGFPKGHIEEDESEIQAALREIREETGLDVRICPGFKTIEEYPLPKKKDVMKRVIYFVAEYEDREIRYQEEELQGAFLMTFEEAIDIFQFESSKRLLKKAMDFITNFVSDR